MNFFNNKDLDEKTKLTRRKSMLNLRYAAAAYLAYLAYRLFMGRDEATDLPSIVVFLAPLVLLGGGVIIAYFTYKEKQQLTKRIEELDSEEASEESDEELDEEDNEEDSEELDEEYSEEDNEDEDEDESLDDNAADTEDSEEVD